MAPWGAGLPAPMQADVFLALLGWVGSLLLHEEPGRELLGRGEDHGAAR